MKMNRLLKASALLASVIVTGLASSAHAVECADLCYSEPDVSCYETCRAYAGGPIITCGIYRGEVCGGLFLSRNTAPREYTRGCSEVRPNLPT